MEDFLDSDLVKIDEVMNALSESRAYQPRQNLEAFRKQIIGRFEEIGLIAEVKVFSVADPKTHTEIPDLYAFDIVDLTWIHSRPFDFDRQVYEVTNDILRVLPPQERGIIKAKPGDFQSPQGHKH